MYKNIGTVAITIVCLIFGIFFITLGIINYKSSSKVIQSKIETSSLPLLRENIYSVLINEFIPAVRVASVISHDYFLKHWVENNESNLSEITKFLEGINNEYGYTSTFFVSNITNKYYTNDGILKVISREDKDDEWFFKFIESGKTFDFNIDYDVDKRNLLTIFVNHRVEDAAENLIGVSGLGIIMNDMSILLMEQERNYNRKIYLVDDSGLVQIHTDLDKIKKINIHNIPGIKKIASNILLNNDEAYIGSYMLKRNEIIVSSKYIKEIGLYLILEHNKSRELDDARSALFRTLVVGFILLLLVLTLVILVLNHFNHKLEKIAATDSLTNIYNRREFDNQIRIHMAKKQRSGSPLSLLMLDIDYFKKINDTHGHQAGDNILKNITGLILSLIRPYDILCRMGGDEFMIILESDSEMALVLASRIREKLQKFTLESKNRDNISITMSMGIYEAQDNDTVDTLIRKTDQALYTAKDAGRDCIKVKV